MHWPSSSHDVEGGVGVEGVFGSGGDDVLVGEGGEREERVLEEGEIAEEEREVEEAMVVDGECWVRARECRMADHIIG